MIVHTYGTWDESDADQFLHAMGEVVAALPAGEPWATLIDFSRLGPTPPEVLSVAGRARDLVDQAGRTHGAYLWGSLDVAQKLLELKIIDPASSRLRYFQDEQKARDWLRSLGYLEASSS